MLPGFTEGKQQDKFMRYKGREILVFLFLHVFTVIVLTFILVVVGSQLDRVFYLQLKKALGWKRR